MTKAEDGTPAERTHAYRLVCQTMHERVGLARLPPPPATAAEWRERARRVCDGMPGLRDELGNVPVGWFPLIEHAVVEVRRLLPPGQSFCTSQLKEKFGTLRWYGHVDHGTDEAVADLGAEGPVMWAQEASAKVCAAFGTADGQIDQTGGWLLTLSDRASTMRRESHRSGSRTNLGTLLYPGWHN